MLLSLLLGLGVLIGAPFLPETPSPEDSWRPCPFLRLDEDEVRGAPKYDDFPPRSEREPFDWREPAPRGRSTLRALLEPIDAVVGLGRLSTTWDRSAAEVSVSKDVSTWVESLGLPLAPRAVLGVRVDLPGLDEADGGRLPMLDPRHTGPRAANVTTGLGLTLGF